MNSRRPLATAIIAGVIGLASFAISVKDGGNADFYWKPLLVVWYVITAIALVPLRKKGGLAWLRERWWLQLVAPVALLGLSFVLVHLHEPFPMTSTTKKANQSSQPTRSARG